MPGETPSRGDQALPPGWPDFSSDDAQTLLAPFLSCTSPSDFLALQQRVDMPRLVARLDAWSAVRLGSRGPVREEASGPLNRQRTVFLLQSLERYGAANTAVLAHFVLDSCHDDDLKDILLLLAQDKRLTELLEQLPSLGPALEARGINPSALTERDFAWSDLGRGLARAGKDALATIPLVEGASSRLMELQALKEQLPPPYQRALDAVEQAQLEQRFSPGPVLMGVVDHMTFGVPLGFYGLVAGTGHGVYELAQGRYEQAVRELAPAALVVTLYAGGKGARWLSEPHGVSGVGTRVGSGLEVLESRARGLQEMAWRLEELLGVEGMREVFGHIRASREAGRLVAVGGVDAALALREARGNVLQAQAMMARARPGATGASAARSGTGTGLGGLASLVDEGAGLTREVVEARLELAELEAPGPRLPRDMAVLEKQRPALSAPPLGAEGNPRWGEYVAYYEKRLGDIKQGKAAEAPLRWASYEQLWGWFTRGLVFERRMVALLEADAKLPRAQRRFLGDFHKPLIQRYVGVKKPEGVLRYADVLIIERGALAGGSVRVETFSFKSRNLARLDGKALKTQMVEDAKEALWKYGETVDIRRDSLQPFLRQGTSNASASSMRAANSSPRTSTT
ncbi:hypothetical protein CYFUS_009607 [Cystobacter fuscus]|uniref:Uncharacterized protein n=1 Tax=Cystobacter fuscus TaxID=43 RepID=A0A250JLZ5_9BACT|nr:hypothetical protein [Cystobacter fuscus]ATB44126.1 hypothetical protein CYFUS_009607 [Cystobacter fuscus]